MVFVVGGVVGSEVGDVVGSDVGVAVGVGVGVAVELGEVGGVVGVGPGRDPDDGAPEKVGEIGAHTCRAASSARSAEATSCLAMAASAAGTVGRLAEEILPAFPPAPVRDADVPPEVLLLVLVAPRVAAELPEPDADDPPDDADDEVLVLVVSSAASVALSCASVASAARREAVSEVGSSVASVSPSVTCWPTRTLTEVTAPLVGKVTKTLFTGCAVPARVTTWVTGPSLTVATR